jgi:hypothetical protein
MSAGEVVLFFSLLLAVSLGLSNLCLTECSNNRECDRSLRQAHSSCDSLKLCGSPECCLNGPSVLPGTVARKVVAPHLWPNAADDSTLFGVIHTSQRVSQTRPPPAEASTSHLYFLHCAFLI